MYRFLVIKPKFDIDAPFWEDNPWIKYISPFKDLYDRDDSKDKSISSKEAYCIWLYCDPSYQNKIGKMEEKAKRDAIKAYYSDFDFEDEIINQCINVYSNICLTPAARAFKIEEESLLRRAKFIDEAEYTFPEIAKDEKGRTIYAGGRPVMIPGTAKEIDSMRKLSLDLFKKYSIIKKEFEEEQNAEGQMFGGGERTLMDEGGLIAIKDDDEYDYDE